jgi:hypothetical protein
MIGQSRVLRILQFASTPLPLIKNDDELGCYGELRSAPAEISRLAVAGSIGWSENRHRFSYMRLISENSAIRLYYF